jgi:hypothetical protein
MKTASPTRRAFVRASAGVAAAAFDDRLVRETLSRQNAGPFTES